MNDIHTGPRLAEALSGYFDFDSATIRFDGRSYFVRCGFTGKVQLILCSVEGALPPVNLGMMSEGAEVLATEFFDALRARARRFPLGVDQGAGR